jgi:hypothetical protein
MKCTNALPLLSLLTRADKETTDQAGHADNAKVLFTGINGLGADDIARGLQAQ